MTPPPDGEAIETKPELRPISKEFVAVIEPAPAFVIPQMPVHVSVEAEPTDTDEAVEKLLIAKPLGALDVPVILRAPVIVMPDVPMVVPLPTVSDATVVAEIIFKLPGTLLLFTVMAP